MELAEQAQVRIMGKNRWQGGQRVDTKYFEGNSTVSGIYLYVHPLKHWSAYYVPTTLAGAKDTKHIGHILAAGCLEEKG